MVSLKRWLDRRRNPWKAPFYDGFAAFRADNARTALLYDHSGLPEAPVVLDIGGFEGEWTEAVLRDRPRAISHIFEPHPKYVELLSARFSDRAPVRVHPYALGAETGELSFSDAGDASSSVADHAATLTVPVKGVAEVFAESGIKQVDLAKINIEGGEYDLLPAMHAAGLLARVHVLRVQFHLFAPEFAGKRDAVRALLSESHDCSWDYPFVWEEWRLKADYV